MFCENSTLRLRSSDAKNSCNGEFCTYSGNTARACGFNREVSLCKLHFKRAKREEACCYPLPGPCYQSLVDCPGRLFPVFESFQTDKRLSTKICRTHLKEADSFEVIVKHPLYRNPKGRKVT